MSDEKTPEGVAEAREALPLGTRDERGRLLTAPKHFTGARPAGFRTGGRPGSERELTEAARGLAVEAVHALAEILRDKRAMALARVRCAEILLERGYGKAPQKIVIETDIAGLNNEALSQFIAGRLAELNAIEVEPEPTLTAIEHEGTEE